MKFEIEIIKGLQSMSSPLLDGVMKVVAYFFDYPLVIALFLILLLCKKRIESLLFLIIEGIGAGLQVLLKAIINRPRPFLASSEVRNILEASNSSFPSGHSVTCMGAVVILFYITYKSSLNQKRKGLCYAGLTLMLILCAFNRMYLGQHHITDCLAGFAISLVIGASVIQSYKFIKTKTIRVRS